ncbi:hypothetical protein ACHAWF_002927 [Thalassiosira exigua]
MGSPSLHGPSSSMRRSGWMFAITCMANTAFSSRTPSIVGKKPYEIVDIFWTEFQKFQDKVAPFDFDAKGRWMMPSTRSGESCLWHEKYSLPYTQVLGFVACRPTSKQAGSGSGKRNFSAAKHIKADKRSHLGTELLEKRMIIYTSACL